MKKCVALLLAFMLVSALGAVSLAEEKPTLNVVFTKRATSMPLDEMKVILDVEEISGVDLIITEVPSSGSAEKINLMIASDDLPDIFMSGVSADIITNYQGQDVFLPVTDYITEEIMPNLYRILEAKPEYKAAMIAPDGEVWGFPYIEEMNGLVLNRGILNINQKWLDELGLDMPTTIDEFKECLVAFRDNDCNGNGDPNDEIPFVFKIGVSGIGTWRSTQSIGQFFGCWGQPDTCDRLYNDNGTVICTANTDAYREGLKWFNELWNEGLIWSDFALDDSSAYVAALNTEIATVGAVMYFSIVDAVSAERRAEYSAVPYLQGPGGEFGLRDNASEMQAVIRTAVTTACEDPALACAVIDLFYDPQRSVETNWGAIGTYYQIGDDGVMYWVDELPDGFDTYNQLRYYCAPVGPCAILSEYYGTVVDYPKDAADLIQDMEKVGFMEKHMNDPIIPPNMWYAPEDKELMSLITSNIYNLIDNYNATAIMDGNIDSTWDAYVASLDAAGLQDYLEIVQRTFDNYNLTLDNVLAESES